MVAATYYARVEVSLNEGVNPNEFHEYLLGAFPMGFFREIKNNPYFVTIVDDSCEDSSKLIKKLSKSGLVSGVKAEQEN